jgi:hypothetical protein
MPPVSPVRDRLPLCVNTVVFWQQGEGLADVNAGRVLTTQELKKSFEVEFGPIAWQ